MKKTALCCYFIDLCDAGVCLMSKADITKTTVLIKEAAQGHKQLCP